MVDHVLSYFLFWSPDMSLHSLEGMLGLKCFGKCYWKWLSSGFI